MKKLMFVLVLAATVVFSFSDAAPAQEEAAPQVVLMIDKDPGPVH